ncbi:hypothetical protein CONLIGDRAFT_448706 [Coniochaeta ligniaria NRRL 30616]|uniref:F-box domain-containing protein n=1 Tax=Coniochaeta ligniaria NRRL 30616 TaxID=1408157 RepID=A0A1J7J372_9PEZI|nr:hypothetical protein CONLIGDRAFT_448706 [Coniochaeta ligniaria NRRL 30616]
MKPATHTTPKRQLPVRAARNKISPATPAPPRPGGRVTRSSNTAPVTPSSSGSVTKRAASPELTTANKRTRRQRPKSGHYEESSDESSNEDDQESDPHSSSSSDTDDDDQPLLSPTTNKRPSRTMPAVSKARKSKGSTALTKRAPTKTSKKARPNVSSSNVSKLSVSAQPREASSPPMIPDWKRLPYYVLLHIFECAAGTPSSSSARWLVDTSLVCRAFTEPALTALYRRPPLLMLQMAHGFADLLSKPPAETSFNYRQKVECLEIEAGVIAAKTFRGRRLDFKILFGNAPRLNEVYVWHEKDQEPYRELDKNIKWTYPADMYLALGVAFLKGAREGEFSLVPASGTASIPKLQGWMWSSRMLTGFPLEKLRELHKFAAFQKLRKLALTNFQLPSLKAKDLEDPEIVQADAQTIDNLVQSIAVLPDLRHLTVECSTAVKGQFLSALPKSIEHLELINCWDVKADHMADYLLSHGSGLRHLTLHHCQSLSLAFLPVLAKACPRLESLRMNLTYYNHHAFYRDSDPDYDILLTADQVPTWPATLRHLDLKNLRKWDKPAAEAFFQSLLDSAPNLPALRHVEIKAMLDIPFRERSQLRDKWEAKLKQVFLRKWVDPLPHFTLRPLPQLAAAPPETPKGSNHKRKRGSGGGRDTANEGTSPPRRSGRIAILPSGTPSRASSTGRDMRDKAARPTYAEPDTDDDMTADDEDETDESDQSDQSQRGPAGDEEGSTFIQGLCDVVDIRFDNQKPVENQFRMEDFLDDGSNDPTDDDWDEDNESDHGYAW